VIALDEDAYERQFIEWLKPLGWTYKSGYDLAPEGTSPERESYADIILRERLSEAVARINPDLPRDAVKRVVQLVQSPGETDLLKANQIIQTWFTEGIQISVRDDKGEESTRRVWLLDFTNADNNDWLVVNQFSFEHNSGEGQRRPDVILFVNGIPISVIELKSPKDEDADIWQAFNQLQTYKAQITKLFYYNSTLVIADGVDARMGSLTADKERFLKWRSSDGEARDPHGQFGHTQTLVEGLFNRQTVLRLIQHFTVFISGKSTYKMLPAYHQYYAVEKAYKRAVTASSATGDGRGGLMWHTQGAGKSFEMACLAGMLATSPELKNPTVIVVTDRTDLDGQLFATFMSAKSLMRETPVQVDSREDLREQISSRPSGGVIFTTIQKFALEDSETVFPALTDRRNVYVMTDEAHRSQYGFSAKVDGGRYKVGYAQHLRDALPNATFIAFTGTPIAKADKDTRQVFGDEIDIYDIAQAIEDGATVPIFYENRLVALDLPSEARDDLDAIAETLVEDEEESLQANLKQKWAQLEAIVGAEPRLAQIANDIVTHFEERCKSPELANGKAMVVAMSRNICVDLYDEIVKLRPDWHSDDHRKGKIKIVFHSSASDDEKIRPHAYTTPQKKELESRFKDADDELKIVIVRDMWLTGYDSPPCHTMYVDKPMRGANLMQAIARVNRVFKDKPGGLVVDYIGIATDLKEALKDYTQTKKDKPPVEFIEEAMGAFNENLQIIRDIVHGVSMEGFKEKPMEVLPRVADYVLGLEDGTKRFANASLALSKAYALVNSQPRAIANREEVAFYQAIRAMLAKQVKPSVNLTNAERELAIKQALANGIVPEGVIDVFKAAGLEHPNIGLLSEQFLNEIRNMKERNLAAEALARLLKGNITARFKTNIVKNALFSDLIQDALARYANRSIETAQLIEELIALAKKLNDDIAKGNPDDLTDNEVAFYDALEANEAAVRLMTHEDLVRLAQELTKKVRENVKIDWSVRESTQAALRVMVRNLLDKYGYPPDFAKEAVETVVKQAELLTDEWLGG
jgi:type I restriction enzyme R subunit